MSVIPVMMGSTVLTESFRTSVNGPAGGIIPFRAVVLDPAYVAGPGDGSYATIKCPNTTFAAGERVIGVVTDPVSLVGNPATAINGIPVGYIATVRTMGVVPIKTDNTTTGTPIPAGREVATSSVATYDGCGAAAVLAGNSIAANQHIVGLSYNKVVVNGGFALIKLHTKDF